MRKKTIIGILFFSVAIFACGFCFFLFKKGINAKNSGIDNGVAVQVASQFPATKDKIKILFLGDLMFDRWIRQVSEKRGDDFVFQKVEKLFQSEDLVVGNLEGPITDKSSVSVASELGDHNNYIFTFPPQTAEILARENIKLVSLGNNHILNQGQAGLTETEKYLDSFGVSYFCTDDLRFRIYDLRNIKIAFVCHNQFEDNAADKTLEDIKTAKKSNVDLVILYTHWGVEFASDPSQKIKNLAHEFIDNGADLIIGSHPHVVQTKEIYKGKTIYYSLGNFIFDQYFRDDTQKGIGVEAAIDPATKKIDFKEYNFSLLKNGQTVQN